MLKSIALKTALVGFLTMASLGAASAAETNSAPKHTFTINDTDFVLDGKPIHLLSGEMHYPRTPHQYWRDRLRKAKVMGLNAVCTYTFWNVHEPKKGEWNFSGDADVAAFCRIAQEEGLWVIVRPGPYVCTEWDFGGYPGWLLKDRTTIVRSTDPKFMEPAREYMLKIGEQLRDLQITRGGPIIMVQVENEYGSFGNDKAFMQAHADWIREAGFDVPLFTSDGSGMGQLKGGTLPGVTATINFGGNAKNAFANLKKFRDPSPRMVGEFWIGWFDAWGKNHIVTSAVAKGKDFSWMVENDISVNFYMFHGGTNFGFMAGSNGNRRSDYTVDTTSYDYSAILDEPGNPTDKFWHFRDIILKKYPDMKLPPKPEMTALQTLPAISFSEAASLAQLVVKPVKAERPKTMEELDQNYGFVLYRTTVKGPANAVLDLGRVRDRAIVTLDGKRVGALDRRLNQSQMRLDVPAGEHRLELLVENLSRVNFGRDMVYEHKGLTVTPKFDGKELLGWEMFTLPCENADLAKLKFAKFSGDAASDGPAFLRAKFQVEKLADTYLDMSQWGKGVVWVNGHNLGRYWNIGPQQALYLPGCWLKKGDNEIVVLALDPQKTPSIAGVTSQIWETKIDPSLLSRKPGQTLKLNSGDVVKTGRFAAGEAWETITFSAPRKARFFCLEALNALDGKNFAAIAEIVFLDKNGNDIPREECSVLYANSEELKSENGSAKLVLDNQPTTWWHTEWSAKENNPKFPHQIVIDLGGEREVSGFRYQPRQGAVNGRIGDYRVYLRTAPFAGL